MDGGEEGGGEEAEDESGDGAQLGHARPRHDAALRPPSRNGAAVTSLMRDAAARRQRAAEERSPEGCRFESRPRQHAPSDSSAPQPRCRVRSWWKTRGSVPPCVNLVSREPLCRRFSHELSCCSHVGSPFVAHCAGEGHHQTPKSPQSHPKVAPRSPQRVCTPLPAHVTPSAQQPALCSHCGDSAIQSAEMHYIPTSITVEGGLKT